MAASPSTDSSTPMAALTSPSPSPSPSPSGRITVSDTRSWASLLHASPRPLLAHLNADTSWLLQLPYPARAARPPGRTHFNILVDPWLRGPQSDVAWWFSTQWHVVPPGVATVADLNAALREVEARGLRDEDEDEDEDDNDNDKSPPFPSYKHANGQVNGHGNGRGNDKSPRCPSYVDAVAISHEFTDHCHCATLEELPRDTPVFAADVAADLIRSWNHFDRVITTPALGDGVHWTRLTVGSLPPWVAIGRVTTPGNALYYHSALLIAFGLAGAESGPASPGEAVIYSPHGIASRDLVSVPSSGVKTLALLHGMHDVRIWLAKQLNLGALNGIKAAASTGAKYWVATHDEVKTGGGFIAPFLQRTAYTLGDAVAHEQAQLARDGAAPPDYRFLELGSGEGLVLE